MPNGRPGDAPRKPRGEIMTYSKNHSWAAAIAAVLLWTLAGLVAPAAAQRAPAGEHEGGEVGSGRSPDPAGADQVTEHTVTLAEAQGGLLYRTAQPGRFVEAPALGTEVHLKVTGPITRGRVVQRFTNPTDRWQEGIYVFPLPADAAVDTLRMIIGERIIEGQIQEKEQARRTYDQARQEGRRASLVEQERPNVFTTSVANVAPGEEIRVEIEYQQVLAPDQGDFRLRFPMVVAPRYIPGGPLETESREAENEVVDGFSGTGWAADTDQVPDASRITPPVLPPGEGGRNRLELSVELDPGFELGYLDSLYHDVLIREPKPAHYEVELRGGDTLANRDFELVWRPAPGQEVRAALFSERVGDATYALLLVVPPSAAGPGRRLPRETVFVVDVSGSMHGESIEQARSALRSALGRLEPGDRFELISFSDHASAAFGASVPVNADTLARARRWAGDLEAEGGTEMLSALRLALSTESAADPEAGEAPSVRQVVFITDGAVGNEEALFSYIEQNLGSRRLFPVGIGSAPNSHFMERAARFGRGTFTYIGKTEEVEERMGDLFRKLESPQLTDLEAVWPDGAAEVWPGRLPDLYQGEPVVVTARLADLAGEVSLSGRRGPQPWQMRLGLEGGGTGAGINKLWARRKIAALMDDATRGAADDEVRAQVVEVALEHHLVSKYTSLVAVDVTPARPAGEDLDRVAVPTELPEGWSYEHVFGALPQGATAGRVYLLAGLLLVLVALVLRPSRRERVR